MTLSEEFTTELNTAIDSAVEAVKEHIPEGDAAGGVGKPAPETVIDDEDEGEHDDGAGVTVSPSDGEGGEGAEAKPAKPVEPVAPVKPVVSDDALTQAIQAGMSLKDARAFASDESLLNVVNIIRASKPVEKPAEKPTEVDPLAGLPKLDPEQYEPEVIKTIDTLVDVVRKQQEAIKAFQSQSDQAARSGQESAARDVEKWFDERVASLGEDFKDTLGTGGYGALDRGSPQFAKREAIASQVAVLLAGYKAAGKTAPPRDEVFDAASRLVLREEYQKAHERKLASDLAKRSKQHINRAGGQKVKQNQDPLAETAALLDAKFFTK